MQAQACILHTVLTIEVSILLGGIWYLSKCGIAHVLESLYVIWYWLLELTVHASRYACV